MPIVRRKITAVLHDFKTELSRLIKLDAQNQSKITLPPNEKHLQLSKPQLYFLTEAIFFRAYQAYENLVRDVFILYCLSGRTTSGEIVTSYLNPKDFLHALELIKSSMQYVDWSNPDIIISRAELYLKDGFPFRLPYTTNLEKLHDLRRIRNHIAHNSHESLDKYKIVIRKHFTTIPLTIPTPGEFLLLMDRVQPRKYKLIVFLDLISQMSSEIT